MEPVRYDDRQEIISLPLQPAAARKRRNWKKYLYAGLLLLPLLLFILGFFVVPMLYILYLSFIEMKGETNAVYSIGNYIQFFTDPYYLHSLWLTIKVSLYTVIVSLLLGYPVALTMAKCSPRVRGLLTLLVASPLLISIVVRNFGWYLLLLPNGTIHQLLTSLGITESPPKLLFSEAGVVIGLSNAYLPFMILSIATSLYNIDPSLEKAAAILGAGPLRSFVSITLPLSLPGIVSGIVLVFSMSMSAYVTPALMGGANVPMLPVVAYDQIINLLRWTYGSAVSYVLLGITLAIVTIFTRMMERGRYREVFR
ncbi:putative spermidine/putrescine transport system permease protein [Parageobacillus thermantarcticus]|uniref:Putative spermidine/putrescine transport system permease protein n=1 Tax=Parageobacillus thermantarcticus TaxID=186116 RepID=A0A1I0TL09_9BACL|nr:ABC transporter permease [Parageobacillus thermantarcticus]SFA52471.1 putative spermidine/putrescine transport system permease protein [Parageobacillus thermantarcticus]